MIPEFIRHEHARTHNKPYPCGYCFHCRDNLIDKDKLQGNAHIVVSEFLDSEDSTETFTDNKCVAGLRKPTHMGDCDKFAPMYSDLRIPCQHDILEMFQSDYFMYVLSSVWAKDGIDKRVVIDRRHRGYQTRAKRIKEMVEDNLLDEQDGRLYLTYDGEVIADRISDMEKTALDILQEGDILDDKMAIEVLTFIKDNPRTSYEEFCRNFGITREQVNDRNRRVNWKEYDLLFYQLIERKYIVGEFDSYNWNTIRYTISGRGLRQWERHQ